MASSILDATDAAFDNDPAQAAIADRADACPEVRTVEVDIDANKTMTERYGVRGLPSLLLPDNQERMRLPGTQSRPQRAAILDERLEA